MRLENVLWTNYVYHLLKEIEMANNYTTTVLRVEFDGEQEGMNPYVWSRTGGTYAFMWCNETLSDFDAFKYITDMETGEMVKFFGIEDLKPGNYEEESEWEEACWDHDELRDKVTEWLSDTPAMFQFWSQKFPNLKSVTVSALYTCSRERPWEHGCWMSATAKDEGYNIVTFSVGDQNLADMLASGQLG